MAVIDCHFFCVGYGGYSYQASRELERRYREQSEALLKISDNFLILILLKLTAANYATVPSKKDHQQENFFKKP
ncbi:hypothetical protein [Shewanella mangrovi]|uniref:hypothetical protein n=1 Tax=Shewanella mangrovi TaxID=1515746 RepID=UPI0012E00C8D|nr:hypothetical protein [Shewanella mangrovi]